MTEQTSPLHHDTTTAAPAQPRASVLSQIRFGGISAEWVTTATILAMAVIMVLAASLRLTHANWDASDPGVPGHAGSGHLHPDERFLAQITSEIQFPSSIANYFDTDTSKLNPYNIDKGNGQKQPTFVYGTFPLFTNKILAEWLDEDADGSTNVTARPVVWTIENIFRADIRADNGELIYNGGYESNLVGRVLSGLFDLGTVVLLFFIGWKLASRAVGVMAAFLYALSPFAIQNSHFFIVDPYVAFFATFTLLFAIRAAMDGGWHNFVIAGIGAGLATASKVTAVSLLPVVVLAIGIHSWSGIKPYIAQLWTGDSRSYEAQRDGRRLDASVATLVLGSLVALLAAFVAFRIAMPYAFRSPSFGDLFVINLGHIGPIPVLYPDIMNPQWLADQVDQQKLLSGDAAFPPNVQWIGRSRWLWPLQQMVMWGMGPALGITAWIGVVFAAVYAWRKRAGVWLVPLAWVLGYFAVMGAQYSLYMRYFLPLYPALAIFAAFALYKTWEWATSDGTAAFGRFAQRLSGATTPAQIAARVGVAAVLVMTLAAGLAFYQIYTEPVTRVSASQWAYENIPEGSIIGHEHWDDEVPYGVLGSEKRNYGYVEFDNFNPDSPEHVEKLLQNLEDVDYVSLSSPRLSGTIPRVPAAWPITSRYYETLESGELGFEKVAEFTSHPEIFGWTFDDTGAEESFSVYDHPNVVIYEKTDDYSPDRARAVLGADAFVPGIAGLPGDLAQNAMMFTPEVLAAQQAGGTWTGIFDSGNLINDHPVIFWLLAMELAAFALVPLGIIAFRALPDRGFLLTKPLGMLALSYLAYAPASIGIVDYTRDEIALGLALMLIVGAATAFVWRDEVKAWVTERWRFIVFAEAFFLLAFLASYWIRTQNPDLWHPNQGGEKPMDLTYLIGVIRTTDLSQGPVDPWNAGGYLNYYYYGQFIGATITKLTGIVPEVAYNLIVPMFFALTAAATFSIAYNLAEGTRRLMRRRPSGLPIHASGPIIAALLAVFLVLVAGNIKAVDVLATNFARVSPWSSDIPVLDQFLAIAGGFKEVIFGDAKFRELVYSYDWWDPSRALDVEDPTEVTPITEFPFWTFLFADLHAHLMALPFSLTAVGVGLGAVMNYSRLNPLRERVASATREMDLTNLATVVILGLIVGALRWINSWDYPPFLIMSAAALIIAERAKRGRFDLPCIVIGVLKAGVMGALSYIFFAPFASNYHQSYNGFHQSDQTTALEDFFSHFGILLALMSGLVLFQVNRAITRNNAVRTAFFGSARRRLPVETAPVMLALIAAGGILVWAGALQRWGVIAFAVVGLAFVAIAAIRELRSPTPTAPIMLFVYSMIGLGLGLCGGVEILTLDGDIGRMNTVFKFYLHVWVLFAIAGAYSVWYVFGVVQPQEAFLRRAGRVNRALVVTPRYVFGAAAIVLLLLALVYPYFGTRARLHNRFDPAGPTGANGMEYMDTAVYQDFNDQTGVGGEHELRYERDAINWMRENVDGMPTVMEGVTPIYHFGSRFAIYTGFPAVSGWQWHQEQQRTTFGAYVAERQRDVNEFYSSDDVARARELLRKYDVEWVVVGSVERNYGTEEGIDKFENGLGGALELAYENDGVKIFHVVPQDQLESQQASAR